jgi:SAM-dependent methyltransferase
MRANNASDAAYVLGRTSGETQALMRRGQLQKSLTLRFLQDAGLAPAMKVLDVGTGAGDVAVLAAELVGKHGSVVGVDSNPAIVEAARARAVEIGLSHITYVVGDMREVDLPKDFDAVIGRHVLVYVGDPVTAVRSLLGYLRPGGLVAFQEYDTLAECLVYPPSPLYEQWLTWVRQVFSRGGADLMLGRRLFQVFLDAGLPEPDLRFEATIGGGADYAFYGVCARVLEAIQPKLLEYGLATAEELDVTTLEHRLRAEITGQRGILMHNPIVGAWAHKPLV